MPEAPERAERAEVRELAVGVVGAGSMGRNHIRLLSALPGARLAGILDQDQELAARLAAQHSAPPSSGSIPVRAFRDLDDVAASCDAVVLAVPTVEHAAMGCRLAQGGCHLLVEKPLASSLAEADRLVEAAEAAGRVLAVGHVEFHNPAVGALLAAVRRPGFVEIQRLSVFTPRSLDVDVVLDLMIHDLQILHALDPSPVHEIRATGIPVLSPKIDIANVRVELESGCVANLTASRVSGEKIRKLRVFSPNHYYSLDYVEQEIKGYRLSGQGKERSIEPDDLPVERQEPLRRELEAFLAACRGENAAYVTGAAGRQALETALGVVAAME